MTCGQPCWLGPRSRTSGDKRVGSLLEQVDLENAVVWISDSKTPNGVAEVPLTDLALEVFRDQLANAGESP